MMLRAPSGVTRMAGANAYAAKFAASPPATAFFRIIKDILISKDAHN